MFPINYAVTITDGEEIRTLQLPTIPNAGDTIVLHGMDASFTVKERTFTITEKGLLYVALEGEWL